VILARLGCDAKVSAKERRARLGNKLLGGITFVTPALAVEFPI
jgi:hypothetical protein